MLKMCKVPEFKLSLTIYPVKDCGEDLKGGDPLEVSIEGCAVYNLKSQIDELIIKTISDFKAHDGECFVEMLIEKDGEYYDSDERWVDVDLENNTVLYDFKSEITVKFTFYLKSGAVVTKHLRKNRIAILGIVSTIRDRLLSGNSNSIIRLDNCFVNLSDCSAIDWRTIDE